MTQQQKLQAFANYLGCDLLINTFPGNYKLLINYGLRFGTSEVLTNENDYPYEDCKLILKPVEDITDEDRKVVTDKFFCESGTHANDYLRSKSYHVPYMGFDLYKQGLAITPGESEKLLRQ